MRPFLWQIMFAILCTGVLTLIGMVPPLLMGRLINDVARDGNWAIFPLIMTLLFGVPVLRAIVSMLTNLTLRKVGIGMITNTRKQMYEHLMRLSMRFYGDMPAGSINQRLMGDVGTISNVMTGGIVTLIADVVAVTFAVTVMLRLNWQLSALTFALLPLYYINFRFFSKRIKDTNSVVRTHMDHISSSLQERLSAHQLIQSYAQEQKESTHFSSQAKQIMDLAIRGSVYNISFSNISAFINKLGNTLIYCGGCYFFVKGAMGYGDVVAFCAYVAQILGPVVRFSSVSNQIVQVGLSIDRIDEILNRPPAIKDYPDARPIDALRGDIRINGLSFQYDSKSPSLKNVDLDIRAGTHLAILGALGSGRSTLGKLLRRFFEPDTGEIEVDGVNIQDYRLRDYRKSLALILPETAIFDGTIRDNLCYGNPGASEQRMVEVSESIGLHDFVAGLALGYDTRLGTGGLRLETGNLQRVGIARALVSDPFILIVDHATVPMDVESAVVAEKAIQKAMKDRTCIMIVHRVLLASESDEVIALKEGRIFERGTYEELVTNPDSLCRELFAKQYGEERLPPLREM